MPYFKYLVNWTNGELDIAEMYFAWDSSAPTVRPPRGWNRRRN